jgi:hypothetical protein
VAVAALLIWLSTAAVGTFLLITGIQAGRREASPEPAEPVAVEPSGVQVPVQAAEQSAPPPGPRRRPDPFAPPTLQRSREEALPGLRDLAEFAHPALAVIGFGFWLGYVVSRDRLFAAIGLGILLGAIAAGVSWFVVNKRSPDGGGFRFTPRVLLLHTVGAALTLLFVALIAARG